MGDEEKKSPQTLIRRFHALQEERVSTYSLFEEGFQAYLKGAPNYNFPMYRDLVHQITQAFQGISQEIMAIEGSLKEAFQMTQLASVINKIQGQEQKKLEQAAQLQILQQNVVDHPDVDYSEELQDKKHSIAECLENIVELMEDLKYESEELYTDADVS